MKSEKVLINAIARNLLSRPDALRQLNVVDVLTMPRAELGRLFKKALRDEYKRRRTAGRESSVR